MTSSHNKHNVEEDRRLNSQHEVILTRLRTVYNILIHPSIRTSNSRNAIAEMGCGTGIWLDDVANTLFAGGHTSRDNSPLLTGFDMNAHASNPNPAPGVQLVEHDCTAPFDARYIGKFDLVNIRSLAYALPTKSFSCLVENATHLFKSDGSPAGVRVVWLTRCKAGWIICSGLRPRPGFLERMRTPWRF